MLPPCAQKVYSFPSPVAIWSPWIVYVVVPSSLVVDVIAQVQPPLPSSLHAAVVGPDVMAL